MASVPNPLQPFLNFLDPPVNFILFPLVVARFYLTLDALLIVICLLEPWPSCSKGG